MGSYSEIMDDSGFPEDTRQSSLVTGNICIDVKGRRTVTGACGPYNLGGSAIEWYQSSSLQGFCCIVLQKLQNDLG